MQVDNLQLKELSVAAVPIIDRFIERMNLRKELVAALRNEGYADAILVLFKNILLERSALYAIQEWTSRFDPVLMAGGKIGDDRIGRSLDRLFGADRATLQTRIVLGVIKAFDLKMERVHSDTTSITVHGGYEAQNPKGLQLKRGHSKNHRPDLKQLVYNLCVCSDGAVPVHFKSYDGNQTDDGIQWETWSSLRSLLQSPDFVYVGDSKLCVEETLRKIDGAHGRFVTVVPRSRAEVSEFTDELLSGEVRWERILRKRSHRKALEFDTFDLAVGLYRLREGFFLYWYRSSQKKKRDAKDRKERIARALEKIESLDFRRGRGPKTEKALRKRVDKILARYKVSRWLDFNIKFDTEESFKAVTRGKPTDETRFRRVTKKVPRLHIFRNAEAIARSKAMDGIFPLTTNTEEKPVDVLKIYKYQPRLEKRHSMLKSTLEVAPVWIKSNTRIEALMFVEYLAQMAAALIERELRREMVSKKVELLASLPEGRPSRTPTIEQILRVFENRSRNELYENSRRIRTFAEPLTTVQAQILSLLGVPTATYLCDE